MKMAAIIDLVVGFIAKVLVEVGGKVDWVKVKEDLHPKIAALVPLEMFDSFVIGLVDRVIDIVAKLLQKEENLNAVLQNLADGKIKDVIKSISDAVKAELV